MPFIQKALVAINDSESSLHAFLQALQFSRRLGFTLAAVSVAPPYGGDLSLVGVRSLENALSEPIRTVLEEAVKIAVAEGSGLETFWAEGTPDEAICELVRARTYDLVIIGQEKRSCWMAWDSLTARLIRDCPVDLLVIPNQQPLRLGRIICLDHSGGTDGLAMHRAEMLARLESGALRILRTSRSADSSATIPGHGIDRPISADTAVDLFSQKKKMLRAAVDAARRGQTDLLVLPRTLRVQPWDRLTGGWPLGILRRAFIPTWFVHA